MQRGWGEWSPFDGELEALPNAWKRVSAEQQCADRPDDYLPDLELVLEWAKKTGGPVLDLACGTGRLSLALARRGFSVVGVDANPSFLQRARAEARRLGPDIEARVRFEEADVRRFRLPERFGLVMMMDQSFKYLLRHDDHLDCLTCVREHLREEGFFLVEHRCLLRLPEAGPGEPYAYTYEGCEWVAVDVYDPIQQVGAAVVRPADDPDGEAELDPVRDFTYAELSLLHRVAGFELVEALHDLDERGPAPVAFDAALVLRPSGPWRPQ
jgi:SAM-dependent methyltransferase